MPDATREELAISRTTHLAIGAHPDDLELIGIHGISACLDRDDRWFSGVVVTDGAGSARGGSYASLSDDEMREVRRQEQIDVARLGQFSTVVQLGYASAALLGGFDESLIDILCDILGRSLPETLYLHNPADRHPTHVAVCMHAIEALRRTETSHLPRDVFGVEVWRSLDWVPGERRIILDVSKGDDLQQRLLATYKSQLDGGKRYDTAILARNVANATFGSEREVDTMQRGTYVLDLKPLICDKDMTVLGYVRDLVDGLQSEIQAHLINFDG